ncbi:hypothetical protein ACFLXC_00015 [Chloroflexota bacterium]
MNKVMIIGSILIVIVLILIVGLVTGFINLPESVSPDNIASSTTEPQPATSTEPSPPQTEKPTTILEHTVSTIPEPTNALAPIPTSKPVADINETVKFDFIVTDISGSGLSRTINTQIANTGTMDAHNVSARVEALSGDSQLKISGGDYLEIDIGELKKGETLTKQLTVSVSMSDGLKIVNNGLRLVIILDSDEYTETFYYDYNP